MTQQEEGRWSENQRRSFHTYNIQVDGGTLTAFYNAMESSYHLNFFPHPNGSEKREHATAAWAPRRLSYSGNAKTALPNYFEKTKGKPGIPKHLVDGLEKLIEDVKTIE